MTGAKRLVWFRRDLRLADNPALRAALDAGEAVLPVYVLEEPDPARAMGGASRWWLHHSLAALDADLRRRGSRLLVYRGHAREVLPRLVDRHGVRAVHWNRRYEPGALAADRELERRLRARGVEVRTFNASLLFEPWSLEKSSGGPFKVFSPFWRACLRAGIRREPGGTPRRLHPPRRWPAAESLDSLGLLPRVAWDGGLHARWAPGEAGARRRLREFLGGALAGYAEGRNVPGERSTSLLSPHLRFGEIGPGQVVAAVTARRSDDRRAAVVRSADAFLSEIGWREFGYHLLHHFPDTPREPLDPRFRRFPWRAGYAGDLRAWQRGRTGIPIVDAGMRELWATGWMHNRVRMIVGSLLVKNLLVPWQEGERWFWDTLVDADLASNTLGWQWVAGCGADAAPYFRVFNPVLQGERFDGAGRYVRRWVPELSGLADRWLHRPWEAPAAALAEAGLRLGEDYPRPVVDLKASRERALEAFEAIKAEP